MLNSIENLFILINFKIMKKSLLTLATFLVATAGFSQVTKSLLPVNRLAETEKQIPASMLMTSDEKLRGNAPRKAEGDTLYYLRPEGTYYATLTPDWRSYQASMIYTAPWYYIKFRNMSKGFPNAKWKIATYDLMELFGSVAIIEPEDNSLLWPQDNRTTYPIPFLEDSESGKTFTLCQANANGTRITADSLTWLGAWDPRTQTGYYGRGSLAWPNTTNSQWNSLYGSGEVTITEDEGKKTYTAKSVFQPYPEQPVAPLGITKTWIYGRSLGGLLPISEGKTLTARITNLVNDGKYWIAGDKVFGTMTATINDTIGNLVTSDGTALLTSLVFTPTDGNPVIVDEPFGISWDGFDDTENVKFGLYGYAQEGIIDPQVYDRAYRATQIVFTNDKGEENRVSYTNTYVIGGFEGMYDVAMMEDNVVAKVTADGGQTLDEDGKEMTIPVHTSLVWSDPASPEPLYSLEVKEAYEMAASATTASFVEPTTVNWVRRPTCDQTDYMTSKGAKAHKLSITMRKLPEGIKGRAVVLTVKGKYGAKSPETITLLQGEITRDDITGIEKIVYNGKVADGRTYNLMGQRVDDNYKGVVISNGKKMVRR